MDRREFLYRLGSFTLAGTTIAVMAACGDDGDGPMNPGTGSPSIQVSIGSNHGHSLSVTPAELSASTPFTRDLTGGGHTHTLALDASEVDQLLAGSAVTKQSGLGSGHTHSVTLTPMP